MRGRSVIGIVLSGVFISLSGCGGGGNSGGGSGGGGGGQQVAIGAITGPSFLQIGVNSPSTYVYSATVTGTSDTSVEWTMSDPTLATITPTGAATPSSTSTGEIVVTATAHADPSKTSTMVVYVDDWILTDYNAFLMNSHGGYYGARLPLADDYEDCDWSYDQQKFICMDGNASSQTAFYIFQTDGTPAGTKLVSTIDLSKVQGLVWAGEPRFSPDETQVIFQASGLAGLSLFLGPMIVDTGGKTPPRLITSEADFVGMTFSSPRFSPDGKQVLYAQSSGLWIVNVDGTNARLLAPPPASQGVLSPDMTALYYASGGYIYRVNPDGSNAVAVVTGNVERLMDVSPNGLQLAYLGPDTGDGNVYLVNVDGTNNRVTYGLNWASW